MKSWKILLILILLLAGILRLWQLGDRPSGISNDEANYIYTAYSIWETGRDITGKFLPLSFAVDTSFSPVNIYLISPLVGILGPSPFSGRLLYAVLGISSVFLVYLLTYKLIGDRKTALLASLIMAMSPWHILISRSAFDPTPTIFFFLLSTLIFIHAAKKGNILWSLPTFFLAFNSYHATKLFFILFIPVLLYVYREDLLKRKKEVVFFLVGIGFILISFLAVARIYGEKRQNVFFWNQPEYVDIVARKVNYERQVSEGPPILKEIISNKATIYIRETGFSYVNAFSLENLFIRGDRNRVTGYSGYYLPYFHTAELVLLIIGLFVLFGLKDKKSKWLIILSLLVAPIPGIFVNPGDRSFLFRGAMMLPFLVIVIALGANYFLKYIEKYSSKIRKLALLFALLIYTFFILRSFYIYYFQLSSFGGENWFRSSRELANYVGKEKQPIFIVTEDEILPIQIAIFNKFDPKEVQKYWKEKKSPLVNVIFLKSCPKKLPEYTLVSPIRCLFRERPTSMIKDSEEPQRIIWRIYEKN